MALENRLSPDLKGQASITMRDVVRRTRNNFPEARFRPITFRETTNYTNLGIDPSPYKFGGTADGTGTKPNLAERLYNETQDPIFFEGLAFDTFATVDGDVYRNGEFLVAILEVLDANSVADQRVVAALAKGAERACNKGRFALLNGETAELGYRTSGYGDTRINWNVVGISIINEKKQMLGDKLKPGQLVVAFREPSARSNGFSEASTILETAYLQSLHFDSKQEYVEHKLKEHGIIFDAAKINIGDVLTEIFGHDAIEQVLPPWHTIHPDITKQLLLRSRLYGPVMHEAQGKIDEPRRVNMIAAAHISGGGVPEKGKRMVESKSLGLAVNTIFPDPEGIQSLLAIAANLPEEVRQKIKIDDRTACEHWNRGIGFMVVVPNKGEAGKLIDIAGQHECEAGVAGQVIDQPEIQFKGHTWNY